MRRRGGRTTRSCTRGGEPGRLLAGEYPGARTAEKTAKKLQLLIGAGVNTIVDLTRPQDHLEPYQEALRTACERAGHEIRYFAHPVPDMDVIDQAGYDRILARIRGEIDSGRAVTSTAGAARAEPPLWWDAFSLTRDWNMTPLSRASRSYGRTRASPPKRVRSRRHNIGCCGSVRVVVVEVKPIGQRRCCWCAFACASAEL